MKYLICQSNCKANYFHLFLPVFSPAPLWLHQAIVQRVSRLPLIADGRVLSQASSCEWCEKWQWDRFLYEHFSLPLSVSFHHSSALTFHSPPTHAMSANDWKLQGYRQLALPQCIHVLLTFNFSSSLTLTLKYTLKSLLNDSLVETSGL